MESAPQAKLAEIHLKKMIHKFLQILSLQFLWILTMISRKQFVNPTSSCQIMRQINGIKVINTPLASITVNFPEHEQRWVILAPGILSKLNAMLICWWTFGLILPPFHAFCQKTTLFPSK